MWNNQYLNILRECSGIQLVCHKYTYVRGYVKVVSYEKYFCKHYRFSLQRSIVDSAKDNYYALQRMSTTLSGVGVPAGRVCGIQPVNLVYCWMSNNVRERASGRWTFWHFLVLPRSRSAQEIPTGHKARGYINFYYTVVVYIFQLLLFFLRK